MTDLSLDSAAKQRPCVFTPGMGPGTKEDTVTKQQAEAKRIADALGRNADDVHFRRVSWEEFGTRNRALWVQAETDDSVKSMVLAILRKDPNWKEQ